MKRWLCIFLASALGSAIALGQKASSTAQVRDPLIQNPAQGARPAAVQPRDRVACSTLCLFKQPTEKALHAIAELGYQWVDLSCLNWARHVNLPKLMEDFETEARRVEKALAENNLRVANLTFDAVDLDRYPEYEKQFQAVVKLAVRLKARLVNLMAAGPKVDRQDYVDKLKKLQAIAAAGGVLLTLETHSNQITERPVDALMLCRDVPGLGLTLDPSHYYAGVNQGGNFDALLPYVQGTGFRAGGTNLAQIQLSWGEGPIDFATIVKKLEAVGYKGFYVAEYLEGLNQLDAVAESRNFLEWSRKL